MLNSVSQGLRIGHRGSAMIGREHFGKYVGGGKCDFGQLAMARGRFQRKRILELVRQFAQFPQSASRRIALQSMNRAADGAHDLFVAGIFFQLERFVVQRLQKFLRGLEKQLAQLGSAVVGRIHHSRTSIRWYAVPLSLCTI